jgi:hypothetical protein
MTIQLETDIYREKKVRLPVHYSFVSEFRHFILSPLTFTVPTSKDTSRTNPCGIWTPQVPAPCLTVLILSQQRGTVAIIMFRIEIQATWWSFLMLKRIKTLSVNGIWLSILILHVNLIIPTSIDPFKEPRLSICHLFIPKASSILVIP